MFNTDINFEVYEGQKPFIFTTFSPEDKDKVFPILNELSNRGYLIWFDMQIIDESIVTTNVLDRMQDCFVFLSFLSSNSFEFERCVRDNYYSLIEQKPTLSVLLEENIDFSGNEDLLIRLEKQPIINLFDFAQDNQLIQFCATLTDHDLLSDYFNQVENFESNDSKEPESPYEVSSILNAVIINQDGLDYTYKILGEVFSPVNDGIYFSSEDVNRPSIHIELNEWEKTLKIYAPVQGELEGGVYIINQLGFIRFDINDENYKRFSVLIHFNKPRFSLLELNAIFTLEKGDKVEPGDLVAELRIMNSALYPLTITMVSQASLLLDYKLENKKIEANTLIGYIISNVAQEDLMDIREEWIAPANGQIEYITTYESDDNVNTNIANINITGDVLVAPCNGILDFIFAPEVLFTTESDTALSIEFRDIDAELFNNPLYFQPLVGDDHPVIKGQPVLSINIDSLRKDGFLKETEGNLRVTLKYINKPWLNQQSPRPLTENKSFINIGMPIFTNVFTEKPEESKKE